MQAQSGLLSLPPRTRGKHADNFKKIRIISNHFRVDVKEDIKNIYIFAIKFEPAIPRDNSKRRMELLRKAEADIKLQISNPVLSGYNVFSTQQPKEPSKVYQVEQNKITIKLVKQYNLSPDQRLLLTFLNNGLRNIMELMGFVEIGRSGKYFNSQDKIVIDSLLMYSGSKANFLHLENGYFLRVDPAKKIVRNQRVLDEINNIYRCNNEKDKEQKRLLVKVTLINKIVMANYGKAQYYRIKDVVFLDLASVKLEGDLTLVQYYDQKYKIKIQNLKQPLLEAEGRDPKKTIYLIPELMLMTGIPQNFDEMRRKTISQRTIKDPIAKVDEIKALMTKIKEQQRIKQLKELGVSLSFDLQKIDGKVVPTPRISLGNSLSIEKGRQSFFSLFDKAIYQSKHSVNLCIISHIHADISQLVSTYEKTAPKLGVELKIKHQSINQADVSLINKEVKKACKGQINICCIVLPNSLRNKYKDVKSYTILEQQIVTQVVLEQTLKRKGLQSIATKLLLQMVAKRGNILWVPTLSQETTFSAMLVGFQQTKVGSKTLLAICATINSTYTMVFSSAKVYSGEQKKYKAMTDLLLEATAAYVKRNSSPPEEIFCFHNTCPRDQIKSYQQLFIAPFKEQSSSVYKEKSMNVSLIMINGRTSERFFSEIDGKPANPTAGTLVNQGLVSEHYDFFLVSQKPTKGTSVPNHYQVVYTDSKIEEGILQEIIFSQCFNYVNWTGSIKVPAILQYAKKAATFRADVLSESQVPESLKNRLYYI